MAVVRSSRSVWVLCLVALALLGLPATAAPARGEVVLTGTAGGLTASFPRPVRLLLRDGFVPSPSGTMRGFVIREASGALVLASANVSMPGMGTVGVFERGQGYEALRLPAGRYRIVLLGDARGRDIVIPVEGLAGRRVLAMRGGVLQNPVSFGEPTGAYGSYRVGPFAIRPGVGVLWAWAVDRGAGAHVINFCVVPTRAACPATGSPEVLLTPKRFGSTHVSAPSTRPPGVYDFVLQTTSAGITGPVAIVGWAFL